MNTVLGSNFVQPDSLLMKDAGFVIGEASKPESSLFVEDAASRIGVYVGSISLRTGLSGPKYLSEADREDLEAVSFTFKNVNITDVNAIEMMRVIVYGIPQADGVRKRLVGDGGALCGDSISSAMASDRHFIVWTSNALYVRYNDVRYRIEIFEQSHSGWFTFEEILEQLRDKLATWLQSINGASVVHVFVNTNGYLEVLWKLGGGGKVDIDISNSSSPDNIFSSLNLLFYIEKYHNSRDNVIYGVTDGQSLEIYPTRNVTKNNTGLVSSTSLVMFSSGELAAYSGADNVVSTGSSSVLAVGVFPEYLSGTYGGVFDFNAVGQCNLFPSKMKFNANEHLDTFIVDVSVATKLDVKGDILDAFHIKINQALAEQQIRMIVFLKFH
jgi:hypothetical protein